MSQITARWLNCLYSSQFVSLSANLCLTKLWQLRFLGVVVVVAAATAAAAAAYN